MRSEEVTPQALEAITRIGVVALLVIWCYEIVRPFIVPIVWGIIIAVAIFPLYRKLRSLVGERAKLAATVVTVALLLLIVGPVVLLVSMLADNLQVLAHQLREGTLSIPPPSPAVKDWPVIGGPIHTFWGLAASNLRAAVQQLAPQLKEFAGPLLVAAAAVGVSMVQFGLAVVLAGIFLAYSEDGYRLTRAIGRRLAGQRGVELVDLSEATVRSVARGVLGVAMIQAFLAGAGLVMVGVPYPGLWTVLALILAIVQIGVGVVMVPAAMYVFSTQDSFSATLFLVWTIIVIFTDNVLKPLLLGRGLEVPMVVIFVGALGGMITSGIIGLFVGAILLALGYKVFLAWLEMQPPAQGESARQETSGS
jgi:predicted PurR-regulated permease PerM